MNHTTSTTSPVLSPALRNRDVARTADFGCPDMNAVAGLTTLGRAPAVAVGDVDQANAAAALSGELAAIKRTDPVIATASASSPAATANWWATAVATAAAAMRRMFALSTERTQSAQPHYPDYRGDFLESSRMDREMHRL